MKAPQVRIVRAASPVHAERAAQGDTDDKAVLQTGATTKTELPGDKEGKMDIIK